MKAHLEALFEVVATRLNHGDDAPLMLSDLREMLAEAITGPLWKGKTPLKLPPGLTHPMCCGKDMKKIIGEPGHSKFICANCHQSVEIPNS